MQGIILVLKERSNYLKHSKQIHLSLHFLSAVTDPLLPFSLNPDNNIGDIGGAKLSEVLKTNVFLTELSLNCNKLLVSFHSHFNTDNKIDGKLQEQMEEYANQNKKMWNEIHSCIRTTDLQQLITLLSKHTINLNSFNLSTDGDTILHSAAKSNNVKMMEYILQRISPSVKKKMMKMKNKQHKLPADLLRIWTPSIQSLFPLKFRRVVKAVLMLAAKRQDGTPYYPQTHFYKLPKDLLFLILQHAAPYN
jgi:hypothetical protein